MVVQASGIKLLHPYFKKHPFEYIQMKYYLDICLLQRPKSTTTRTALAVVRIACYTDIDLIEFNNGMESQPSATHVRAGFRVAQHQTY